MIATAKARFVRISSRKVKLVIDLIRGKNLEEAFDILRFIRKAAAAPVRKLVQYRELRFSVGQIQGPIDLKHLSIFIRL